MISPRQGGAGFRMLVAAVIAAAAFAGPAMASTVSGRLAGAPIPAAGAGQAFVRAVNLQTGAVAAVDDTDAAGRYRVTVPKGAFALFPTVVRIGKVSTPKPTKVRLKRGQRRSVTLRARQTAVVQRPVYALPDNSFTGGTGEFSALNKGLRDMLITDLLPARTARCQPIFVERSAQFAAAYALELSLARRGLLDPATAIRPGLLINPTRGIRGTIRVSGDRLRITAETYRWSSKRTLRRTSVEGPKEQFFALEQVLARRLAALLCASAPAVSGTFTGSLDYARVTPVGVILGTLGWSGSLELTPLTIPGLPPQFGGPTTSYQVSGGSLDAHIRITPAGGGCTISGQRTFDIKSLSPGPPLPALAITEGDPDTYRLALDGSTAQIPTLLSDCPPGEESSNGRTGVWPLLGIGLLPFSQTPAIRTEGVFAGSATGSQPGLDDGYSWTWNLRN